MRPRQVSPAQLAATLLLLALGSACATGGAPVETGSGEVATVEKGAGGLETVVIVGTNDIHGTLAPLPQKTREKEGVEPVAYQVGGAAMLASYLKTLRQELGSRLLWLDAGDQWQGSIDSGIRQGAPVVAWMSRLGLDAAAVGNHEFDFGLEAFRARLGEASYPYLAANLVDRSTGKAPEIGNLHAARMLKAGGVRVGVIGLATLDTPRTTRASHVAGLEFTDLKDATLRESRRLREEGAEIVVLTAHVGLDCGASRSRPGPQLRKPTDPQAECEPASELVRLLKSVPAGTVDAVVAGHSHRIVHHWVAGIPVIQAADRARYLNLIYLTYDRAGKKVLAERTRIEGPIPVCPAVFRNQGDCNGERAAPREGRGPLVPPRFRGRELGPDAETRRMLEASFAASEPEKRRRIGEVAAPIEHSRTGESAGGNLMADAVLAASPGADFALVNTGGVRSDLEKGALDYEQLFRYFPFDNAVSRVKLTGKELKLLLRIAESGARGFPSVAGLRLRLIEPRTEAPSSDLDGNGRIEPWEINRLLEAASARDGRPLEDARTYELATYDFLVTGGDDWGWFIKRVPSERITVDTGISVREALASYIGAAGPLNSAERPLLSASDPRLKFEKPPKKSRKARRSRRKR
jgi:5'-nucleotidase